MSIFFNFLIKEQEETKAKQYSTYFKNIYVYNKYRQWKVSFTKKLKFSLYLGLWC